MWIVYKWNANRTIHQRIFKIKNSSPTSVYATLKKALQAEHRFKKPFVEFTFKEILEMYESQHSRSTVSIQNQNVILKHATRWFIASGFTKSTINNKNTWQMIKDMI